MGANEKTFEIIVNDGTVRVPIKNEFGDEIGSFKFRPTDIGIIERYKAAMARLDEIAAPLDNAHLKDDGTPDEAFGGAVEAMQEAQRILYEICDEMFDGNMSEAFFSGMAPFSPVGGRYYFEIALENVGKFIGEQFKTENKKLSKRSLDYTRKYAAEKGKKA